MSHLHQKVSALVDGELKGAARERAIRHIGKCADCRRELEETLALKARLSGLPTFDPSPDLFVTLDGVSSADHPDTAIAAPGRSWAVGRRLVVGAGTLSVAVLSLAYVVGAPDEPAVDQVAPPVDTLRAAYGGAAGDDPLADTMGSTVRGEAEAPTEGWSEGGGGSTHQMPAEAMVVATGDDRRALGLLRRAARVPGDVSFAGVREVTSYDQPGTPTQTLAITHVAGQGTTIEETESGETAFLPDESHGTSRLEVLVDSYDVDVVGSDRVLGRAATVVGVGRAGDLVARVWIDDETGLILQRALYDGDVVVRATRYLSLDLPADDLFLNHVGPEPVVPETDLGTEDAARMRDAGWACPESLTDGFELTGLTYVDAGSDVMHAEYTDGLSTISLFSEPGTLDPTRLESFDEQVDTTDPVYVRSGLPSMVVWESDGTVYTLVSDAPASTVDAVVDTLPHVPDDEPGVGSRVGAGLDKMATFLTPLG